jgi:predicted RNA methylase
MAARWHRISPVARKALESYTTYDGPRVDITEQLGPDLWRQVKTILEKLGAVYVVGASAFEFEADQDARALVGEALAAGRVMAQANLAGFVATPADLAEHLVWLYGEYPSRGGCKARVLEPSAGTGRFVTAAAEWIGREWLHVTAVEPDARRARQIERGDHVTVIETTFEAYAAKARATGERFDLILMNPPFSLPGKASIWVSHLRIAFELLAPGGRLVAIVPASVFHEGKRGLVGTAQRLVEEHGHGCLLEKDAFAESGIEFETAVVWLDRPLIEGTPAGPAWDGHPSHFRTYTGEEVPVVVDRPLLTRAAARSMPVQWWADGWRGGKVRTLRYCAECIVCQLPVWGFDDGENDPRGVLGNHSAGWSIDPDGVPELDTAVGLCIECADDRERYDKGHEVALELARVGAPGHALPRTPEPAAGQLTLAI